MFLYDHAIRATVVKIGNSRGIRMPHTLLEQAGLTGDVEMVVEGEKLIIHYRLMLMVERMIKTITDSKVINSRINLWREVQVVQAEAPVTQEPTKAGEFG